jgi:hypothetical protein
MPFPAVTNGCKKSSTTSQNPSNEAIFSKTKPTQIRPLISPQLPVPQQPKCQFFVYYNWLRFAELHIWRVPPCRIRQLASFSQSQLQKTNPPCTKLGSFGNFSPSVPSPCSRGRRLRGGRPYCRAGCPVRRAYPAVPDVVGRKPSQTRRAKDLPVAQPSRSALTL